MVLIRISILELILLMTIIVIMNLYFLTPSGV